jgi:LuxR family maltose regulon positive regulatory protein
MIRQALGDQEGARSAYRTAQQLLSAYPFGEGYLLRSREFQVRCWLFEGDLERASRWAGEYEKGYHEPVTRFREYADQGFIRVLVAERRYEAALTWLDRWIPAAEAGDRRQILVTWYAFRAVCHKALGNQPEALADLKRALAQAQPEGYLRSILDVEDIRFLILDCRLQIAEPNLRLFAEELLSILSSPGSVSVQAGVPQPGSQKRPSQTSKLVEPLTERELDVLRLIADGFSNQDIARKLYVSANTLKAHTQNIYTKLDVHSRLQAVNRARELGILPPGTAPKE